MARKNLRAIIERFEIHDVERVESAPSLSEQVSRRNWADGGCSAVEHPSRQWDQVGAAFSAAA